MWTDKGSTDFFLKPDMVIVEDGVGKPKLDLKKLTGQAEGGTKVLENFTFANTGIPISNIRFSLL